MLFHYTLFNLLPTAIFASLVVAVNWRRSRWDFVDLIAVLLPGALWLA